jgi:ATP synthase subunit 6
VFISLLLFTLCEPLAQFDLIAGFTTCAYDTWPIISGLTDFIFLFQLLLFTLIMWLIFDHYNVQQSASILEFDGDIMIINLISKINYNYFDIFLVSFSLIFICNLFGILPYIITITSHLVFTLFLAITFIFLIWTHFVYKKKMLFVNHFLPSGTPTWLVPFIIVIEVISVLSRVISLAVRLFANITSGHALLKILASFGLLAFFALTIWMSIVLVPSIVIFFVTLLELIIAVLQAYVFTTLLGVYVAEQE